MFKRGYMKITSWLPRKRREQKRADALAGKTTSGHLSPGERSRIFRNRPKG